MYSLSSVDSVAPQDSACQAGHALPLEGQFVSLSTHGPSLQSMLLKMISSQVTASLNNLASLPANSLFQAEHLASSRPTSPKSMVPSGVQKALPAESIWGGSLGPEPSRVRSGKCTTFLDALSSLKWSRSKVEGDMWAVFPLFSLAQDPDVGVARVLDLLAHHGPLGQGQTACDVKEHQAPPVSLSELGCTMLCCVTPLLRPRPPRGWTLWCLPQLCIVTITKLYGFMVPRFTLSWAESPPLPFISGPSMPQGRDRDYVGGDREVDFSDNGMPDPTFTVMMDFVYETFPEARGPTPQDSAPLLLGMQHGEVPATTPSLRRAQPIDFMMLQAFEALACANESTRSSFAKYPAQQYNRCYRTSSDKGRNCPAKVNSELLPHLTVGGEPHVRIPQGDMVHLEQVLLSSWNSKNFLFWLMGSFVTLMLGTRPLVKRNRLLQCCSLRPQLRLSLNRSLNRGHHL